MAQAQRGEPVLGEGDVTSGGTSKIDGIPGVDRLKLLLPTDGSVERLLNVLAADPGLLKALSDDPTFQELAGPDFAQLVVTTFRNLARLDEIARSGIGRSCLERVNLERQAAADLAKQQKTTELKVKLTGEEGVNFGVNLLQLSDLIASLCVFAEENNLTFDVPAEAGGALSGYTVIHPFEIQGRSLAVIEENEGKGIALIYKDQHSETWYKVNQYTALSVGHN